MQKGLSDQFTNETLQVDPRNLWPDVRKSIDALSSLTHVGSETFDIESKAGTKNAESALYALSTVFASMEELSCELGRSLHNCVNQAVIDAAIAETNSEIDLLSSNSIIEGTKIQNWEIVAMDSQEIQFVGEGIVYVSLEWGRGDDYAQMSDEFPFRFSGHTSVSAPLQPTVDAKQLLVDTSEWFE